MLRKILYLLMLPALIAGCSKSDDDDVKATENSPNWLEVKSQWGGSWNRARYPAYDTYGITMLANDSLGTIELGPSVGGLQMVHTEYFNLNYNVYSEITTAPVTVSLSSDTTALLLAASIIEDYALSDMPKSYLYRPTGILLANELTVNHTQGTTGRWTVELTAFPNSVRGVGAGKVDRLADMTENERKLWAGAIVAARSGSWITLDEGVSEKLQAFYDISGTASIYGAAYTLTSTNGKKTPQDVGGFLYWRVDGEGVNTSGNVVSRRITPIKEVDVKDYVAAVYAFRTDADAFVLHFSTYNGADVVDTAKIRAKYAAMLEIVGIMEAAIK